VGGGEKYSFTIYFFFPGTYNEANPTSDRMYW